MRLLLCFIFQAVTFCKTVLNEYASKLNIQLPTYKSVEYKEVIPYFVCTLDLNGTSYTGDAARRKKDAVELAARAAILSILGILSTPLLQNYNTIIRFKGRYAVFLLIKYPMQVTLTRGLCLLR